MHNLTDRFETFEIKSKTIREKSPVTKSDSKEMHMLILWLFCSAASVMALYDFY